jgi:hypothetical protein
MYIPSGCVVLYRPSIVDPRVEEVLKLRHYLQVTNIKHRRALTYLLLSTHGLAIERMRWRDATRGDVPRHLRTCRLCHSRVETPEHALLECEAEEKLNELRQDFYDQLESVSPKWFYDWATAPLPMTEKLKRVIANRDMVAAAARHTYHVLSLYEEHPLFTLV